MTWTWKRAVHALRKRINAGDFAVGEDIIDFWVASSEFDPTWHEAMKPLAQQALAEKTVPLQLIQETGHYTQAEFVQAQPDGTMYTTTWLLPRNDVWNVPEGGEVRGEMTMTRGPFASVQSYAALAVDSRFRRVFGWRRLQSPREDGYNLRGRVSLGGELFPAFTSSQLFRHRAEPGAGFGLVDVATLYVSFGDWPTGGYDRPYVTAEHPLPKLA